MTSVFVLSSNHGTHTPDMWADMISKLVFPISPDIAPDRLLAAKNVQVQVALALIECVAEFIEYIKDHLHHHPDEHLASSQADHAKTRCDDFLSRIFSVTDKSEWATYMRSSYDLVRLELTRQLISLQHVECLYFADNNRHLPSAQTYLAKFA